jgi:hypothetical protein
MFNDIKQYNKKASKALKGQQKRGNEAAKKAKKSGLFIL